MNIVNLKAYYRIFIPYYEVWTAKHHCLIPFSLFPSSINFSDGITSCSLDLTCISPTILAPQKIDLGQGDIQKVLKALFQGKFGKDKTSPKSSSPELARNKMEHKGKLITTKQWTNK